MTFKQIMVIALFGTLLTLTAIIMMLLPYTLGASAQTIIPDKSNSGTSGTAPTGNNDTTKVKYLFIQGAESGSVSKLNTTASTLELNNVTDRTILLSDRPDRIVSSINTTDFIENWGIGGPSSFVADPPNAVIVLDDEEQKQDLAVVDLYNPVYNSDTKTLKFDIKAENVTSPIDLPLEFGQSTLVIDDAYDPDDDPGHIDWSGGAGEESPGED